MQQRFNQRQGFLVSAILHLTLLMLLVSRSDGPRAIPRIDPNSLEKKEIVFLPSQEQLRRLLPPDRRRPAAPAPAPTPVPTPPSSRKDRISIGPPSEIRQKGPIVLRREDDLTQAPKGTTAPKAPIETPPTPAPAETGQADATQKAEGAEERSGRQGLRLPPGLLGQQPRGEEGVRPLPGPIGPAIAGAVEGLARRVERDSQAGVPTGTGRNLAGLHFDPQGADFTVWVNRFKDEVYRNWVVPEAFRLGVVRGHVDFEFVVERDGTMSSLRLLKSSGTASLDRAARYALEGSRLLPLPDDYGPPKVTMQVTFYYGEGPQGS